MCNLINTHTHTPGREKRTGTTYSPYKNKTGMVQKYSEKAISPKKEKEKEKNACDCRGVCIYGHIDIKSMDQPGKAANPARRDQLNRKNEYPPLRVRA